MAPKTEASPAAAPGRPLNLGHRGARALAPENTLAGLRAGLAAGADGVEIDVQRSADGHLVLFHDDSLQRVTGVAGRVVASALADLRRLDAGRHFGPQFAGEPIPTLDEAVDALPSDCFFNLEAKRLNLRRDGLEEGLAAFIGRRNLYDRCLVSSFNPAILWRIGRADPRIPLGLLHRSPWPRWPWLHRLLRLAAIHPRHSLVTPALVCWAHDRGLQVNVWTVNEPAEMRRLIGLAVDAIITDRPDVLAAVLAEELK